MLLRLCLLFLGFSVVSLAEDVAWAGKNPLVDQWKDELARLRAARKPQPLVGCLHSEAVLWERSFGVVGARLLDTRALQLSEAAPEDWKTGRALVLCYDEDKGATLLDPATGRRLAVRHVVGRHPIDGYIQSLRAETTVDMLAVNEEAQRLWRLEIDRSVREVLALRYLPAQVRADFAKLSKARLAYVEQQAAFAAGAVYATYPGGSICGPASGDEARALYRAACLQLSGLYEYYRSFDEKPEK